MDATREKTMPVMSKEYFTTGEAAELINISRSTISRKFDRGVFFGKKNPITGERMISRESITTFMQQYHLPLDAMGEERKRVLVGTADEDLFVLFQKALKEEERIQLSRAAFGGDVLVKCLKERPDVLILDDELSDIPSVEVVRSLRRMEEQSALKVICLGKGKNTRRCTEWGADEAWSKEGLGREEVEKRLRDLLGLPEEGKREAQAFEHQRRWPRVAVGVPAKIGVYRLTAPHRRDSGKAVLDNISCGGAYVTGMELESGAIPCEAFRLLLEVDRGPLKNMRAHCKVVRLQSNGSLTAGLEFVRLSRANLGMIQAFTH